MKHFFLFIFLYISALLNAQWDKTVFDKTNPDNKLRFSSSSKNGKYIWGTSNNNSDTNIYYSIDGGYSFEMVTISHLTANFRYGVVSVVNDSMIFLGIANGNFMGKLFSSSDFGKTWKEFENKYRDSSLEVPFLLIYDYLHLSIYYDFFNNKENCPEIWNSADGGKTWVRVTCDSIDIPKNKFPGFSDLYMGKKLSYVGFDSHNTNGYNLMLISENYGQKWYFKETNIPTKLGSLYDYVFRDSLVGFAKYKAKPDGLEKTASTIDGGRNWDTAFQMPGNFEVVNLKYAQPATANDTGFWIGYSPYSSSNYGSFISYDDLKTTKKLDNEYHQNMIVFNSKKILSSVDLKENLFIYTGKENNAGIIKNISKNYRVYPNPFKDEITIKTEQHADVYLYNLEGKCMFSTSINIGENQLFLNTKSHSYQNNNYIMNNELQSGIYILEIQSENSIERIKLVKSE